MKINAIEIDTDLGRRVVKLTVPLDVDLRHDMPPTFRSLTEQLWRVLQMVANNGAELAAAMPKAEA